MTIDNKEMLSALVDGELTHEELDQALAYLKSDNDAEQQFIQYQKLSDVMRGYQSENVTVDLTARLATALDSEPTYSTKTNSKASNVISFPRKVWKQVSGLAVAASIGAMAVLGVVSQQDQTLTNVEVASADSSENISAVSQGNRWTVSEPEVQDRLNNYLVDHNEYSGASGVFSYARVVSYESE
jgi:sigma-E factor negative regulatory protein RseA